MTKLECTSATMDRLHGELHKLRAGTTTVKVSADDLFALLRDHAKLLTAHKATHQ